MESLGNALCWNPKDWGASFIFALEYLDEHSIPAWWVDLAAKLSFYCQGFRGTGYRWEKRILEPLRIQVGDGFFRAVANPKQVPRGQVCCLTSSWFELWQDPSWCWSVDSNPDWPNVACLETRLADAPGSFRAPAASGASQWIELAKPINHRVITRNGWYKHV